MLPVSHPGRLLKRGPDARGLSASGLARALGVSSGRVTDILNGRRSIGADISLKGPKDRRAADIARRGHGNAASGTAGGPGAAAIPSGFLCKRRANIRETLERRPGSSPGSTALVPGSPCGRPGRQWGASRIGSARFLYFSRSGKSRVRRVRPAPVVRHEFHR